MASIRKRDGKNGISYQVRYLVNGTETSKSFNTKREANAFKKEIEAEITLGLAKYEENIKFKDFSTKVFEIHDVKASVSTKKNRMSYLKFVNEHFGDMRVVDITPLKITNFFIKVSKNKSDQVLLKYKQILNIVFDYALTEEIVESNPVDRVKYKISQKNLKPVEPIDEKTFEKFIEYTKDQPKYYHLMMLLKFTGMRIGEALAITFDDFDFKTNTFIISKSRLKNGKIGKTKKDKTRKGIIHSELSELIFEIKTFQSLNKHKFAESYNDNKLVICHEDGNPIVYSAVKSYLERIEKRSGIKIRPHQLRHTFITNLILSGVNPKVVQTLSGHEDISTTMDIYTKVLDYEDNIRLQVDNIFK